MWYLNNKPIKNPVRYEADGKIKYVYIPQAEFNNPDNDFLPTVGCVWVDPPKPVEPEKAYSKLKIKRKLTELGKWEEIKSQLEDAGVYDDFLLAEKLLETDPMFAAIAVTLPQSLLKYLDECLWEED